MMTTSAYLLAWLGYLLAAGGLLLVLYKLTQGWRPVAFRVVLRAVLGVWLLVPVVVEPGAAHETLAPAYIVLLFSLHEGWAAAARVLEPMLMITVAAIPAALAIHWSWSRWRADRPLLNEPRAAGGGEMGSAPDRVEPTLGDAPVAGSGENPPPAE